jgi:hypothetical protein
MRCDRIDGIQNEAEGDHDEGSAEIRTRAAPSSTLTEVSLRLMRIMIARKSRYTTAASRQTNAVGRYAAALVTFAACGPF